MRDDDTEKMDHGQDVFPPSISWKLDFGGSGLAIKSIQIKASVKQRRQQQLTDAYDLSDPEDDELVTFQLTGDKESLVDEQVYLGGMLY